MRLLTVPLRLIALILIIGVSISFTVSNMQSVPIALPPLSDTINIPLYLLSAMFFSVGLCAGVISCVVHYTRVQYRIKRELRSQKLRNTSLEQELLALQTEHKGHVAIHETQ